MAVMMIWSGKTYKEVGEHFGVTAARIHQLVSKQVNAFDVVKKKEVKYAYPAIQKFMKENDMNYQEFAIIAGVAPTSMRYLLIGKTSPTKETIDKILEVTGLTYEDAFAK